MAKGPKVQFDESIVSESEEGTLQGGTHRTFARGPCRYEEGGIQRIMHEAQGSWAIRGAYDKEALLNTHEKLGMLTLLFLLKGTSLLEKQA